MAPTKSSATKKPPKELPKPIEKPISKSKKTKKKNYQSYSRYIYKILRTVTLTTGIARKSMVIMNDFVLDMLEKLVAEAGRLVARSKKSTLSSREVQTAVRLLVPGELAKHAHSAALKAVTMYHNSRDGQ